jgi:hypothetical protein
MTRRSPADAKSESSSLDGKDKTMPLQTSIRNQRGAITIHVAIALIALLAFVSFVTDYGVMWVSRRQAQNAADAGALAGAISLIHEGSTATAKLSAGQFASTNPVWGQANAYGPGGNVDVDVSGTGAGETSIPPCGTNKGCVRVDVFRNEPDRSGAMRGNVLPTYFSHLVGVTAQGVRATATAQTAEGNSITCLLPFAVIDRWSDNTDLNRDNTYYPNDSLPGIPGWSANDKYEPPALAGTDVYVGPYAENTQQGLTPTGWTVSGDYGRQLIIKDGNMNDYSAGWAQKIDLVGSTGSNDYSWNITHCNPTPIGIATFSEPCAPAPGGDTTGREINGCVSVSTGMSQGPTVQNGITPLIAQDPGAHWSATAPGPDGHMGAVVDSSGAVHMSGPRVRPIVIFDINHYIASGCTGTNCIGKVANIIGFFVEGTCGNVPLDPGNIVQCEHPNKDIVGRIVTIPGSYVAGVGDVIDDSSFVKVVRLVR